MTGICCSAFPHPVVFRSWAGLESNAVTRGRRAFQLAAVSEATLAVLRDRRAQGRSTHPFYWAGFVAAGEWW